MSAGPQRYDLVAVPRKFIGDRGLRLITMALGHSLPCRQPFRWLFFRDVTVRAAEAILRKSQSEVRDDKR